jgi:hypothetical protein
MARTSQFKLLRTTVANGFKLSAVDTSLPLLPQINSSFYPMKQVNLRLPITT